MKTLAIVEDSKPYRNKLVELLGHADGITLSLTAVNGREFLEKLKETAPSSYPDIVLMDIEMPELNGIETVYAAKELYPQMNFIMLTSFDDDDKIFEAIKAGAGGYLLKEESREKIMEAIATIAEGAPMSPRIARKTLSLLKQADPGEQKKEDATSLSPREMEVLKFLVDGLSYQQIGDRLFISPLTVKKHIRNIYDKLHVNSKVSAVKLAVKKGWFRF